MSRSVPRASWGEEVSSPRVRRLLITGGSPSPSPLYVFHITVRGVAFAFDFRFQDNFGTRPLVMDTLAENARGTKCMCLTRPPVRAQKP